MFEVRPLPFPSLHFPYLLVTQRQRFINACPSDIVTLYRTLETPSYLLLLLEYVPGQDLFYFLEQSCDHYEPEHPSSPSSAESHTPPTPSLLSSLNPTRHRSSNLQLPPQLLPRRFQWCQYCCLGRIRLQKVRLPFQRLRGQRLLAGMLSSLRCTPRTFYRPSFAGATTNPPP